MERRIFIQVCVTIDQAKTEETRQRRIEKTVSDLIAGKK